MSVLNEISDEDAALAAEYVLGLLSEAEEEQFARRLFLEAPLRHACDAWSDQFAAELEATAPVAPPETLWPAIKTGAFGPPLPLWRRLNLGTAVIGGALAAGLAFAALQFGWVAPAPDPMTVRLSSPAAGAVAQVTFDPDSGALTARLLSPDPAPGRARELWLIAGETAPISLGVLPPGGVVSLALPPALQDRLDGAVLAISDEPAGGSPSGRPSGAVLASGALSAS